MYIETSSPRVENDKARIVSRAYTQMNGFECLTFYYHMFGESTGSLVVYYYRGGYKEGSSLNEDMKLFEMSGNQGNFWHIAQVKFIC